MQMDPQFLLGLIRNNLQGSDNQLRKKAEHSLVSLYTHNADELTNTYLDILAINNEPNQSSISNQTNYIKEIKRFVIVQLKNCLARKPRPPYHNIWPDLTQQTQQRIKKDFYTLLNSQADPSVMKILAGTIGRLAANLIVENDSAWPEFRQNLLQVFVNGSQVGVYCGFYILQSFYDQQQKHFKDIMPELYHLFETSFQLTTTLDLKISAMKCFNSFLLVLDHEDHPKYHPLVPPLIRSVVELRLQNKDNTGLNVLSAMLESEPKFFKPYFQLITDTFVTLYQSPELMQSEKKMLTQTLVEYCDNYPSLFRSNVIALSHLIDMIVMHMLSVPKEITDSWLIPQEGFDQEYSDENQIDTTRYGLDSINSVIKAVGSKDALKHIQAVVEKLGSVQNWRYHYTAIMIMGQLGEYVSGVDKIQAYLITVFNALDSENPMLRYAACHAIGIFSDDLKPKFQQKYGIEVFNKLTELLYAQPAPRVVSHIQGALVNFLEGVTFDLILPHFHKLSSTLIENCQNGISLVKQSALNAITSLVEIAHSRFQPYIQYVFNFFKEFYTSNQYQDPCYNNLRGIALETLSYVAVEVTKGTFLPFLSEFIEFLIKIPNSQDKYQPPLRFIINAWQRLSIFYAKEVDLNTDRFLPDILEMLNSAIADVISSEEYEENSSGNDQEEQNQSNKGGKSYRMRMVEDGVVMLGTFSQNLPSISSKYLQPTLEIYSHLLRNYPIEDTKELVSKNIPKTLQSILCHNIRQQTSKSIISDLILSFQAYRSSLSSEYKLIAIHKILAQLNYPLFTLQQLHILTEKLFYQLQESERQKQNLLKQSEGFDEDEMEHVEGEIENQEDVQFNIIQIIGDIFKIYKTNALYLAKQVLNSILIDVWVHSQRQVSLKSALFVIDDIVEHIGYEYMQNQWPSFEQMLSCHVIHPKCAVRQAASYGLGILAQRTPPSLRNQEAAISWLQKLNEALAIDKKKRDKLASYLYARDNIVAAIGKIMRVHIQMVNIEPYLPFWLIYLPIKKDKLQTYDQTKFLVDLVLDYPRTILQQQSIDLQVRLITIFGQIIKYQLYKQDIADRLYQCIEWIVMREFFQKNMDKIMENIQESLRNQLFLFFRKSTL